MFLGNWNNMVRTDTIGGNMRVKTLLILILIGLTLSVEAVELSRTGWNLIGICQDINKSEINMTGIEEIQAQDGRSIYTGANAQYSNLNQLEAGYGYWIKGSSGVSFSSGDRAKVLKKPLLRDGWNLMASCENIARADINLTGITEIQSQDGESIYTGNISQYSNLETLFNGYGYWVKGSAGTEFISKRALMVPKKFNYRAINNRGNSVEESYKGYRVRIYADRRQTADDRANHVGVVVILDGNITIPTLNIQESYRGENIVVAVYAESGELIAVSSVVKVSTDSSIIKLNLATNPSGALDESGNFDDNTDSDDKDRNLVFQGLRVFATPLTFDDYRLEAITDTDFNALSLDNQRIVANKLLALLFYGIPKIELDAMIDSGKFISTIKEMLNRPNSDLHRVEEEISKKNKDYHHERRQKIMARLFNLSLGKEYINRWVAYQLTQTIMFSPAYELATVGDTEISNVYNNLVFYMDDEYSMNFITYLHMISNDNWKRFRSPEDNGREMLEIFLYDYNDSHVPRAATALKNWRLDTIDGELDIGLDQNTVPQSLFGVTVTTGLDFYRELVKSEAFLHGVIKRLVEFYFTDYTETKQDEIVALIKSSRPEQFQDILLQIVFSKEFLYNSTKIKSFEETAYHMAKKMSLHDGRHYFIHMDFATIKMGQGAMKYKLGREATVPLDTLSFAYYYNFVRERIMVKSHHNYSDDWGSGWGLKFTSKENPGTDIEEGYVDYLFLATISRLPTFEERATILELSQALITNNRNIDLYYYRNCIALIAMEYISRLSELYIFKAIEE